MSNLNKSYPKVSIITVCFNSAKTIKDTIQSVASQDYPDIEHIIVDGGSTDGTVEIISNASSVNHFVSEPDKGIYDAMNKGILMAEGDIIGILNADDFYARTDAISLMASAFSSSQVDACYADLVYVTAINTDKIKRYWKSCEFESNLFLKGWMPAHPTFFVRRSVYKQYGLFNLDYRIAADVEMLFRLLEVKRINTVYLPKTIIKMRLGGTTNKSLKNIQKQNQEVLMILDAYYDRVSRIHFFVSKILNRCQQFLSRPPSL
ncbi:glycosyltransferase family 2 protein [Methylophaga sp.]|uniref:glycosyltransferase family 2 protein n=1 Tax=Methylophaga sp. TaxID=2024840 RepID=UPI0025F7CF18|nr:glycosyltransferase family 2 protein [Methylophaga sp.]